MCFAYFSTSTILFIGFRKLLLRGASVVTGSPCAYDVALWVFSESLAEDVETLPKELYESNTCCLPFCPFGAPMLNYSGNRIGKLRLSIQSLRMPDYELVLRMVMWRREEEHGFDDARRNLRVSPAGFQAISAMIKTAKDSVIKENKIADEINEESLENNITPVKAETHPNINIDEVSRELVFKESEPNIEHLSGGNAEASRNNASNNLMDHARSKLDINEERTRREERRR